MIETSAIPKKWNSFWHGDQISETSLDFFRFFFYVSLFVIFSTDYYGQFFLNLSQADSSLLQPTPLSAFFSLVPISHESFSLIRMGFLISCAFNAVGFLSPLMKIIAAVTGVFILNFLSSFGNWNHSLGPIVIVLVSFCFFPCSYKYSLDGLLKWKSRAPAQPWLIKLIQVMVIWSYFSSGLYKLFYGGLRWVSENSLYNYFLFSNYLSKQTTHDWLTHQLVQWPALCWLMGLAVFVIELTSPIALFNRRLRPFFFITLAIMQVMIYFSLKENFVMLLPLLPAFCLNLKHRITEIISIPSTRP